MARTAGPRTIPPQLEWDFRVPRVESINTGAPVRSRIPGLGRIVWRDSDALVSDIDGEVAFLDARDAIDAPMLREGTGSHCHHRSPSMRRLRSMTSAARARPNSIGATDRSNLAPDSAPS
jgi:hypothetical protein